MKIVLRSVGWGLVSWLGVYVMFRVAGAGVAGPVLRDLWHVIPLGVKVGLIIDCVATGYGIQSAVSGGHYQARHDGATSKLVKSGMWYPVILLTGQFLTCLLAARAPWGASGIRMRVAFVAGEPYPGVNAWFEVDVVMAGLVVGLLSSMVLACGLAIQRGRRLQVP